MGFLQNYKKFKQRDIMAMEVQASAEDSTTWVKNESFGDPYIKQHNNDFQPVIDVTIHKTDGTRHHRRNVGQQRFFGRKDKALAAAEDEAAFIANATKQRGIPVLFDTAADRNRRNNEYKSTIPADAFASNPQVGGLAVAIAGFVIVTLCIMSPWLISQALLFWVTH